MGNVTRCLLFAGPSDSQRVGRGGQGLVSRVEAGWSAFEWLMVIDTVPREVLTQNVMELGTVEGGVCIPPQVCGP